MKETSIETPQPEEVEQITKEPEKKAGKGEEIKDRKKVKGGKGLAKKDKEARRAKAAAERKQGGESQDQASLISNIQIAGSVVGACFVLWHGWLVAEPFVKKNFFPPKPQEKKEAKEPTPPPSPVKAPAPEPRILME